MKLILWKQLTMSAAVTGALLIGGCSDALRSVSGSSGDLVLSGILNAMGSYRTNAQNHIKGSIGYNPSDVDYTELQMACVTLSFPPVAGTGAVSASGAFNVTLADASGNKVGCFVLDADNTPLATLVFKDDSETDMNGSAKTSTGLALEGEADLGTISLDFASGKAEVDVAEIKTKGTNDSAVKEEAATDGNGYWDASGTWVISNYANRPRGYQGVCSAGATECHGPTAGEGIYLQQVDGFKVESGVTSTNPSYGLMIWRDEASYTACGSRIGTEFNNLFDFDGDGPGTAGLDLTGNPQGVGEGAFTTSDSVSCDGGTVTDEWKCSLATTQWPILKGCGPVEAADGTRGWQCTDSGDKIQIGLDGGACVISATNEPVFIDDWSKVHWYEGMNCDSATTETHTFGGVAREFSVNACYPKYDQDGDWPGGDPGTDPGDADDILLKCTHGYFEETGFDWNNMTEVAAGTSCDAIADGASPDTDKVEELRCFANYYHQNQAESGCMKRYDFDWGASSPDDFVSSNRDEIETMYLANVYDLGADGTGVVHDEKEHKMGIPVGGADSTAWTDCRIREAITLSFSPTSSAYNEAIVTMTMEEGLIDMDKDACVAFFAESGAQKKTVGSSTFYVKKAASMFKVTKQ